MVRNAILRSATQLDIQIGLESDNPCPRELYKTDVLLFCQLVVPPCVEIRTKLVCAYVIIIALCHFECVNVITMLVKAVAVRTRQT